MLKTGIIILAAGSSSRLGRPKQFLDFKGSTLIGYLIGEAIAAALSPVVVVGGAVDMSSVAADLRVRVVYNPRWEEGMGSSIAVGVAAVQDEDAVIVAGCDQPHVSAGLFQRMTARRDETGKGIVACAYSDTAGIPVLFNRRYFQALSGLSGQEGAKKFFRQFEADMTVVPFPEGAIDIDTEDDYERLLSEGSFTDHSPR